MAVWGEHLLPLLTRKDAARLGCTCKVLRVVVREHFRSLGMVPVVKLQEALTTFPRARTMTLWRGGGGGDDDWEALADWLRQGGHGEYLTRVTRWSFEKDLNDFVHAALRKGALPSLKSVTASLVDETQRAILTEGLLGGMHELRLSLECTDEMPVLAALGLVRQLPVLITLDLEVYGGGDDVHEVQWPPFIPPSLKALHILVNEGLRPPIEPLLRALPGMLGASGARLERLELTIPHHFADLGDGLLYVAQALRCCSPTLRGFHLSTEVDQIRLYPGDDAAEVERLRVQWAGVLAGVSACRELQLLLLPGIEVEPLFLPGTAFGRLTHLQITDYEREDPPEAGGMRLWELMASGGLPALAKLRVSLAGRWGGLEEVRTRVAPALEAVSGTLTHLTLKKYGYGEWLSDEVEMAYELGVAVGKLRRLKDLHLDLFEDGRAHRAFAQGLAASGGDRPLPLLWRVTVSSGVKENPDQVASLLLPSVRVFGSAKSDHRAFLLMACGLRQVGYKHTWVVESHRTGDETMREVAQCRLADVHWYAFLDATDGFEGELEQLVVC
jgi:hypothetical protein